MADDEKTYSAEEFSEAVEAEVKRRLTDERESLKLEKTFTEEEFNAEKQKRIDVLDRFSRRELVKRIQARANVPYSDAVRIAGPFFERLTPQEDNDVKVRLASGGTLVAGFTVGAGWSPIDQLAAEAIQMSSRNNPPSEADVQAAVEKKRRSSVFRSVT